MEGKLQSYIESVLGKEDFEDCFLVELIESPNMVKVYFDSDGGLPLSKCQKLSRMLEGYIEENALMPEKYKIDVSSPGLDRPLKFKRQYKKNLSRKLKVVLFEEEQTYEGILESINEEGITLAVKKKKIKENINIEWSNIRDSWVLASF